MIGFVTINTDASFHQNSGVGGYAFWIVCDALRLKKSGVLKEPKNSMDAEIMAIANALHAFYNQHVPNITDMVINTDCRAAMGAINGKTNAKDWPSALHARLLLHRCKERYGQMFRYRFKHVKAHSGTKSARKFVNNFCDNASRNEVHVHLKKSKPERST